MTRTEIALLIADLAGRLAVTRPRGEKPISQKHAEIVAAAIAEDLLRNYTVELRPVEDSIGRYYEGCAVRQEVAWARYDLAKLNGADTRELNRLHEAAIDAGNTGD